MTGQIQANPEFYCLNQIKVPPPVSKPPKSGQKTVFNKSYLTKRHKSILFQHKMALTNVPAAGLNGKNKFETTIRHSGT